jgi:dipeptidyl aminopeptidase/acylaminoacyl peptidase
MSGFGGSRLDFAVGTRRAFLILPPKPRPGKPWIWYAPTFIPGPDGQGLSLPAQRHEWLMSRLLAAGIAVGGVDVGESYGNPAGRAGYTEFHGHAVQAHGLSPRACLLPQSRGGLMLYNWAAEHPEAVRCIGGIYPVCDLRSYPGMTKAAEAYGMEKGELERRLAEHNPVDRLSPLARAGVPILHLHGDADVLVPLEPNSGEVARRYRMLGGSMDLVVVHGVGHKETDDFFLSEKLLSFFLEQAR